MAVPSINDLHMWVGTLFTKDDWDFNFSQLVNWLSGGNADLVINSAKVSNGIDLDGSQISNLGPATTGSQAITLDQANTLLNRTSVYNPFSVASGKVDSNGNAAYIQKDSDTQVTVLAGNVNPDLVCVSSDGTIESVTSNTVLTVPSTNGTYYIVKEKGEAISITTGTANVITIGKTYPSTQNIGDYFLNNSVLPFTAYKYTTEGWEETPFCYLGYVTVSGGVATVTTFPFDDNKYNVNRKNQNVIIQSYRNGASGYNIYSNGYCEQWGRAMNPSAAIITVTLLKQYVNQANYNIQVTTNTNGAGLYAVGIDTLTSNSFNINLVNYGYVTSYFWRTSGYIN